MKQYHIRVKLSLVIFRATWHRAMVLRYGGRLYHLRSSKVRGCLSITPVNSDLSRLGVVWSTRSLNTPQEILMCN